MIYAKYVFLLALIIVSTPASVTAPTAPAGTVVTVMEGQGPVTAAETSGVITDGRVEAQSGQPATPSASTETEQTEEAVVRRIVCIDPGHQKVGNNELEPDGPGSSVRKPKVTSGTRGTSTGKPEHELNLEVSLLLKSKLEQRGYAVVMTRETDNVDLSNKDRAVIANEANAELFVRIHADGDTSARTSGITVLYPGSSHPAAAAIAGPSKQAARTVLEAMIASTGAKSRGAVTRSDLSGFNWAEMPSVLVEMGFMTNPEEDRLMATADYQEALAEGMAQGIDDYFAANGE